MRILLVSLVLVALPLGAAGEGNPVTPAPKVPLRFDRFYDYKEVLAALDSLARAHEGWLKICSIGKSAQGRDMPVAVLCDPEGPPDTERPAIYIDANVHGNEIQGTEVCLYTLWYLLENRDRLEPIRELLRRVAFYVVPTVNPDAREAWFHEGSTPHSPRSGLRPMDEDRDGVADEDGPDDLDGDGSITSMRKKVATGGTHRLDPEDPRLMVPAPPGEDGDYVLLGWEGIDNDGDGEVNEDGPGGYDMNRNNPRDWQPSWIQYGAGPYPLCWPETRAVAEFVSSHPNIAALQSYHNSGGMILRGPGVESLPRYPREDFSVYDRLGKVGEEMLPHYRYLDIGKDLYPVHGGFVTWAFESRGIFAFTNELWTHEQYRGHAGEEDDEASWRDRRERRLDWNDRMEWGAQFTDWKPYDHPQYGAVEIGGFRKTSSRVPPLFMLEELCHRNAAFTLHHAREMPELALATPEVEPLGEGLFRVRAEVANRRLIPTVSGWARDHRIGLPDFFVIDVEDGRAVAGGQLLGPPFHEEVRPRRHRPQRIPIEGGVPSHGRVRAEWITTSPRVRIRYVSEKGGTVRAERKE